MSFDQSLVEEIVSKKISGDTKLFGEFGSPRRAPEEGHIGFMHCNLLEIARRSWPPAAGIRIDRADTQINVEDQRQS